MYHPHSLQSFSYSSGWEGSCAPTTDWPDCRPATLSSAELLPHGARVHICNAIPCEVEHLPIVLHILHTLGSGSCDLTPPPNTELFRSFGVVDWQGPPVLTHTHWVHLTSSMSGPSTVRPRVGMCEPVGIYYDIPRGKHRKTHIDRENH